MESEIEMDDKSFLLVRKNLNILSILIILLAFTNATLESLNFLGIQLKLDSHRFYVAILIIYLYFIWRFWTKLKIREGFLNDFTRYFLYDKNGVVKRYNFNKFKDVFLEKSSELIWAIENDPNFRVVNTSFDRETQSLIYIRMVVQFRISYRNLNNSQDLTLTHNIEVSKIYLAYNFLKFCLVHDKFGDYLFPLVPVSINLFFFLFKNEWQGSLLSLIY